MRKIQIIVSLFCVVSLSSNILSGQCVFNSGTITQTTVNTCLSGCSPCTVQITGPVTLGGNINLSGVANLIFEITSSGSLTFPSVSSNIYTLTLSSSSTLFVRSGGNLIRSGGGINTNRITIGSENYTANDFPAIVAAGGANSSGVLPVELTQFDAQSKDDMVELAWTTATELNNDFFQIEHSRDGIQFDAVGKVKGVGTTTETINYNFMHRQPASGTNYYRLKQVDFDGAYEYSDIISVEVYSRTNGIRVYPNPTVDRVFIQVDKQPKDIQFALTTILGQKVDVQPATGDFGWELDLARLPKGIYVLQLDYDGKSLTKRIVKE